METHTEKKYTFDADAQGYTVQNQAATGARKHPFDAATLRVTPVHCVVNGWNQKPGLVRAQGGKEKPPLTA